ncbi:PaaI family thioesterase [Acidovorax cavernicola]|uniref:PaaI family thioesterase n=1 Tax=Acidovorax cavernicola TaxID=1675792 RepID=A0A9X8GSX9_9BURK|nr:PaaI family thioesterase [Acidovorax cavernicola]RIX75174.1 PaaI family thioesterase [Acidovorax cavernicola]
MLDTIQAINKSAAFNRWAGFEVTQAADGQAELRMKWREDMGQYTGFLHAGMIGALLDTVSGFAAATLAGRVLASHFSVNCISPAIGDAFVARGRVVKAGRKQVFVGAELFAQSAGQGEDALKLVATANAILVPVDEASTTPKPKQAA